MPQRNSTEAKKNLEAARAGIPNADLGPGLEAAQDGLATANDLKAGAEEELRLAKPEEVEHRRQQALENLQAIETTRCNLDKRNSAPESSLTAVDKGRIREQLEEACAQQARTTSRGDRVQAEADARRLLVEILEGAERDATRAFLEPVLQRVQPFLDLLFPGMGVTLEEETLEHGTREQLSIVVRLAFAVYLREKGYPAVAILDDALVYADPSRLRAHPACSTQSPRKPSRS
jgi:hypothetical protein